MFKQIFGKRPLKSSHNDWNGEGGVNSDSYKAALRRCDDVEESEKTSLFLEKMRKCCVVLDFSYSSKNHKEKDIKRQTLLELVDYVELVKVKFDVVGMQVLTEMVAVNLFRTFPNKILEIHDERGGELWEEEEPAWPHIQLVYEILLRFVISPKTDTMLAERYVNESFIAKLLDLFESEDQREREYLKTILHRLYGKFMVHRPYIRQAINDIFNRFISETEKHNGIAELLEIYGSIANGFALPLEEEHTLLLEQALIPLHKPKCVQVIYHEQLSYCVLQFVEKDFKLADTVIIGLLEYWPMNDSAMEVMFLGELKEVLKATKATEFMVPLFKQIARCLNSSHFQVAKTALFLWNNDHIIDLITRNREVIMPIFSRALESNPHGHWKAAVHGLYLEAKKVFNDIAGIAAISLEQSVERNSLGNLNQAVQSLTQDAGKVFTDIAGISALSVGETVENLTQDVRKEFNDIAGIDVVSVEKSVERNSHGNLNQAVQSLTQDAGKVFNDVADIVSDIAADKSVEKNSHGNLNHAVQNLTPDASKVFSDIAGSDTVSVGTVERNSHGNLNQAFQSLTQDAGEVFSEIAGISALSVGETVEKNSHGNLNEVVQSLTSDTREVFSDIAGIAADKSVEKNSHGHLNQAAQSLTQNAKKVFSDIAGIAAVSVGQSVEFTLEELADATGNFDLSFKIGQGGFGAVYYAKLRGKQAAIKKMNMEASKEFLAELKILTHVHHVNLVHLIGFCVKGSLFLVYEYVENGNLQQHLHGRDPLPWTKRVQIALDSARGLEYIHEHTVPTYVHRDIKCANILLDQSFRAKVADFGLTKLVVDGGSSTRPMGTFGYMAPEIIYGEVSAKVDVYAFGVVLYQLISAKRAVVKSKKPSDESRSLVTVFEEEVFKAIGKEKALRKIIDPRLGNNYPFDSVYKMAKLARACTQGDAKLRPSMSNIVSALSPDNWDVPNVRNYDLLSLMFGR